MGVGQRYIDGYVLDNESKTIFIEVLYQPNKSLEKCTVKESNGLTKEYTPKDIKGYGYLGGKYYASTLDRSAFAIVLVRGSMSLWKEKAGLKLISNSQEIEITQAKNRQLKDAFEQCPDFVDKEISLTEADLIESVVSFNKCIGSSPTVYSELIPRFQLALGLELDYLSNELLFDENRNYPYLSQDFETKIFQYGIKANLSSPKILKGFSLDLGLFFARSNFNTLFAEEALLGGVVQRFRFNELFIEYSSLTFPIAFKYARPLGAINIHGQAGLSFQAITNDEVNLFSEEIRGDNVFVNAPEVPFALKNSIGLFWGIGVSRNIGALQLALSLKQLQFNNIVEEDGPSAKNRQFSLGLSLTKTLITL